MAVIEQWPIVIMIVFDKTGTTRFKSENINPVFGSTPATLRKPN
jgi:hypothetical protein